MSVRESTPAAGPPNGNPHMRRLFHQAAHAAGSFQGSTFEMVYRRRGGGAWEIHQASARWDIENGPTGLILLILHGESGNQNAVSKESKPAPCRNDPATASLLYRANYASNPA